ncbi:ATP-binding protein [Thermomonospora umbrina]|uniref:ATP-binding protein n=1 Tax=Thermomonospora umbrina TaxID=111806 RepID=UPI0011C0FA75|nr:ATP-binding protein [Thermomonospora umbrina]
MRWHDACGELEIAVWDDAPGEPHKRRPGADAENGRGLQIVEELADDWGWKSDDHAGKIVWATFAAPDGTHDGRSLNRRIREGAGPHAWTRDLERPSRAQWSGEQRIRSLSQQRDRAPE